uniref:probable E3 ubiquitin-protein ligase XBOS34 n=1 Tax=Erigeron canadensis TaxID=72917 RepID=UPI001CB9C0DC|nr:probable E3 ubiquitin-protein ligase XBOS34 [Erigeron canadensis]
MEKRTPAFLTSLLKRSQKCATMEEKGWKNTTDNTTFNGWRLSPGSSEQMTNGWADKPPDSHHNGWGLGSAGKLPGVETSRNGWTYDKPKDEYNEWMDDKSEDEYNGWGSGLGDKSATPDTSSNGWMKIESLANGWSHVGQSITSKSCNNVSINEPPENEPVSTQANIDMGTIPFTVVSRPLEVESWTPKLVPSAPPLPEENYEYPIANISDHLYFDSTEKDVVSMNAGQNGDPLCVVCWEARVEGACIPCGHMASCMSCLHEIESKQGSCPICRVKIDKVIRIYAISTN